MTGSTVHEPITGSERRGGFSLGAWVRANAVGLGLAYAMFGLFGDAADALGARHGIIHGVSATGGLLIGGGVFVMLRRRVLAPHVARSTRTAIAAGVGLAAGFIVGVAVAGPPFDFILGAVTLGTVGGGLQWRLLRDQLARPGGLLMASIAAWLVAGVTVGVIAVLAGDSVFHALGDPAEESVLGIVSFTVFLLVLGVAGGTAGGLIEGRALRDRLGPARAINAERAALDRA